MSNTQLKIVALFASALDREDYDSARALLAKRCVYRFRGETIEGPEAVLASYRGNGEAAGRFDAVAYGSSVRAETDGWAVIEFWDELTHRGRRHRHQCEQRVRVDDGSIATIEHRDLDGEVEALEAFKEWCFGNGG